MSSSMNVTFITLNPRNVELCECSLLQYMPFLWIILLHNLSHILIFILNMRAYNAFSQINLVLYFRVSNYYILLYLFYTRACPLQRQLSANTVSIEHWYEVFKVLFVFYHQRKVLALLGETSALQLCFIAKK